MPSQEPLVDDDKSGEEVELPPEDPEETDASRSPSLLCACVNAVFVWVLGSFCPLSVRGHC